MKIKNRVEMLSLSRNFIGSQGIIHPTLIVDEDNVILVDTGEPIHLATIFEAMEKAGIPINKLNKVIITHQDIDHIGTLPNLLTLFENKIEVLAHELEKPYIEGETPLIKLNVNRLTEKYLTLSEDQAEQRNHIEALLAKPPSGKVDRLVKDGEILPYCGGITVLHTPGHTPGHISLYLNESKTLITGDAIVLMEGKLREPLEQFTPDMDTARKSLKKFTNFDVETIICYHGGLYSGNANEALAELAKDI
jgi:glyoxylase-like metal-dependent hydrolase (beta-lactamase superfamily II)